VDDDWSWYFDQVKRWQFSITGFALQAHVRTAFERSGSRPAIRFEKLATNRLGTALGAAVRLTMGSGTSGLIVWLPPPTEISPDEAISLIIRNRYGIRQLDPEPDWMDAYRTPDEIVAGGEVSAADAAVAVARAVLGQAQAAAELAARWRPLLYAQGDPLHDLVHAALNELGAELEPYEDVGRDGKFTCPAGRRGVLEVRGSKGYFGADHVRAAADRRHFAHTRDGWDAKAVLVANMRRLVDPAERADAYHPNALDDAGRLGVSVLTTGQVYRALADKQSGGFHQGAFWDAVMKADGMCKLPEAA